MAITALKSYTPEAADRTAAPSVVVYEDDNIRIIHYTIRPGEQTGWHRHELDYVVLHQSEGRLTSHFADGSTREFDYTPGKASAHKAPVEHNAVNNGEVDIVGLEIEYRR